MKNHDQNITYCLYARKSSEAEDRQVASIEAQEDEMTKMAERDNFKLMKPYYTEAKSAKEPGRKKLNEMLAAIEKGEAQGIICWKLDRLARNPIDGGRISWMLQQGIIKEIRTFDRVYLPTDNVLMMQVELGMANQYVRDLSTNTKRGLRARLKTGWFPGVAPIGYKNNKYKEEDKETIYPDPENFETVERCWAELLKNNTSVQKLYHKAVDEWNLRTRQGNKPARSMFYRIFSNPFYYGYFLYNGEVYEGNHQPMITYEQFQRAQVILGNKSKPAPRSQKFAFTGMIKCGECGASITAEKKKKRLKNGGVNHYTYYHCTKRLGPCSQKCLEVKKLEEQVSKLLKMVQIPKDFHVWAMDALRKENEVEIQVQKKTLQKHNKAYTECAKSISGLIEMRANREIDADEFALQKQKLTDKKLKLEELRRDTEVRVGTWLDTAEQVFNFAETARERFATGDLDTKRQILSNLGQVITLKDRKVNIELSEPLPLVLTAAKEVQRMHERLEPKKTQVKHGSFGDLYSKNPMLLRGQGSNL